MKKMIVGFLALLLGIQSLAFASTQAESEYRWNRLDLRTRYSTQVSGSMSVYQGTGSGYVSSQDIENWYITKGEKTISEVQYLRLLGDNRKADEIIKDIETINSTSFNWWIFTFGSLGYAFLDIFDGNDSYTGVIVGCIASLGGMYMALSSTPPAHYLVYEEVGPQIDNYNAKLKSTLGLPADYKLRI